MNIDNDHIDPLIARYLAGEASPDEALYLDDWMDDSEENRKYFNDIRFLHNPAVSARSVKPVNTDLAWKKVQSQIQVASPKRSRVRMMPTAWLRIAASVLILLGFTTSVFLIIKQQTNNNQQPLALVASDSASQFHMTDSTEIALSKGGKITYSSEYGKKNRKVALSGQAFFDVKHQADNPFIVKAEETFVKDIGTSFNVKAIPQTNTVEVYVETGEVSFYTLNNPGVILRPGESGIYYKITRTFVKKESIDRTKLDYKRRSFVFQNTRLVDVVEMLNRVYDQKISIANPAIENCKLTVSFQNESIEMIVGVLAETLGLKYASSPEGFSINGIQCDPDIQLQ